MNAETRKKITVECFEPLNIYGGIRGPIKTPYYETLENIGKLLMDNITVYEWVGGQKIKLDISNFDRDNTPKIDHEKPKKEDKPKVDATFELQKAVNQNKPLAYPNAKQQEPKKEKVVEKVVEKPQQKQAVKEEKKKVVKPDIIVEE